jgi:uncharacterized protein YgbK (DUF1537 family)
MAEGVASVDNSGSTDRQTLGGLDRPPATITPGTYLSRIRDANQSGSCWTVVLDDDPTGTQTTRDVPVLMGDWSKEQLEWGSQHRSGLTFALTNSRSLDERTAEQLTYDIVDQAARVAAEKHRRLRVVSRSDSTLRGHFRAEITAAHRALAEAGRPAHGTVFVPAFLEAGRLTAGDVQWVATEGGYVPAAQTEFARDATFGYTEENLNDWVGARLGDAAGVAPSIRLEDLRAPDGIERVSARIAAMKPDGVLVANATHPADLEILMLGLLDQETAGRRPVIRSGPSFVRLCAGQVPSPPVRWQELHGLTHNTGHGLVVVGSHTASTNAQLAAAIEAHHLHVVELDAATVVDDRENGHFAEVGRCIQEVSAHLRSHDVVLATGREVLTRGRDTPLLTSRAIADALVEVVAQVASREPLRFLVAKGGITSSDMAVRALSARRALVTGQMLPGTIPLWELLDGAAPGLPYVVFPGNVGDAAALSRVLDTLGND